MIEDSIVEEVGLHRHTLSNLEKFDFEFAKEAKPAKAQEHSMGLEQDIDSLENIVEKNVEAYLQIEDAKVFLVQHNRYIPSLEFPLFDFLAILLTLDNYQLCDFQCKVHKHEYCLNDILVKDASS